VKPFVHSGHKIEFVVAVSRYLSSEPLANLEDGKRTGVNLVFDPTGNPLGASGVSQLLATAGLPFLAGSIVVN
jgi:hypothetical protein